MTSAGGTAPGRGRGLSLDRIVDETIALIDDQGIGVASMRTVGERLGVSAMSLYRYVANREQLFDAVVERIVSELNDDPMLPDGPVDGWRPYLERLAWGVRRYARAHPHAFPLVATRPPTAPWVNPPLRSLRWIEAMLSALRSQGFTEEQTLFAYRSFNSFLLGFLLLETSAMALRDPKPGDGSFQSGTPSDGSDPVDPTDPVPGGLSPTRDSADRAAVDDAETATQFIDPAGEVDRRAFPTVHELRDGLAADFYEAEFAQGLAAMLDRITGFLDGSPTKPYSLN